ncbi:MAG: hypothetical protein NVS9B15_22160 [Acidobacteriaceae bacterium]
MQTMLRVRLMLPAMRLWLALLGLTVGAGFAQSVPMDEPHFRGDTHLAIIPVTAHDRSSGRPLPHLQPSDFLLFDNGKRVAVTTVDSGSDVQARPVVLWLVVQCPEATGDNGSRFLRGHVEALRAGLQQLQERSRVAVAHWCDDGQAVIDLEPTLLHGEAINQVQRLMDRADLAPSMQDNRLGELALQKALRLIYTNAEKTAEQAEPVIVFLYNDASAMPLREASAILNDLIESFAVIYGIGNGNIPDKSSGLGGFGEDPQWSVAHYLSKHSGGAYLYGSKGDYATPLAAIIQALQFGYQIGFVPPVLDGKQHRLELRLSDAANNRKTLLLYRTSYVPRK